VIRALAWAGLTVWLALGYLSAGPAVRAAYTAAERNRGSWDVPPLLLARVALAACTLLGPVTWAGCHLAGDSALRRMVPEHDRTRRIEEDRQRASQARDLEQSMRRLNAEVEQAHRFLGIRLPSGMVDQ
jgi:hypothetical protein